MSDTETRVPVVAFCAHCETRLDATRDHYWWCGICKAAYCTVACIGCLCSGIEKR